MVQLASRRGRFGMINRPFSSALKMTHVYIRAERDQRGVPVSPLRYVVASLACTPIILDLTSENRQLEAELRSIAHSPVPTGLHYPVTTFIASALRIFSSGGV